MTFLQQVKCARQMSRQAISLPWQNKRLMFRLVLLYLPVFVFCGGLANVLAVYARWGGETLAVNFQGASLIFSFAVIMLFAVVGLIVRLRLICSALDGQEISWRQVLSFDRAFVRDVLPLALLFLLCCLFVDASFLPLLVAWFLSASSSAALFVLFFLCFILGLLGIILPFSIVVRLRVIAGAWRTFTTSVRLIVRNIPALATSFLLLSIRLIGWMIVALLVCAFLFVFLYLLGLRGKTFLRLVMVSFGWINFYGLLAAESLSAIFVKQFLPEQQ